MGRIFCAFVAGLAFGGPATLIAQEPSIVGVWEIVKLIDWDAEGKQSEPFGSDPNGYFIYTPQGRLILHILPNPLPSPETPPITVEELAARARSSIAYFGTYSVDYDRGVLVHEVVVRSRPTEQVERMSGRSNSMGMSWC